MKILKIYPRMDHKNRYNYHVNYDLWDKIEGDKVILEDFNVDPNSYDVIFLPMFKRWQNHHSLLDKIKSSKAKTVLFDNDSCYRSFKNPFYKNLDFIFYKDVDQNKEIPLVKSAYLPWSIDTSLYTPSYGNTSISFICSINSAYPLRQQIHQQVIKGQSLQGKQYIETLQSSGASIHTSNPLQPAVRAKILEMAACGTQIISDKSRGMNHFFPEHLITYFDSLKELKEIITTYKPNIKIQKELRHIVETKHDSKVRAEEVLNGIKELFI
jgi:glycosyltransferase involved in cell wall biosynthesis